MHALLEQSKNIVFDVGKVLLSFNPEVFVPQMLPGEIAARLTYHHIFENALWLRLDEGTVSEETVARLAAREAGDEALWPYAMHVIQHFQEYMEELPTTALIGTLHAQGKKVFVLSNYGLNPFARAEKKFNSVFSQLDGMVISARDHLIKPDPRIYRLLLSRYQLSASDSVFIDDRPDNVAGAQNVGMGGILFTGMASLLS